MDTQSQAAVRLAGKTAIVTGACGGIGREIVRLFAREGAKVIAADLAGPESVDAKTVCATAPTVEYHQLDIASEEQVLAFFDALGRTNVEVDILINNAGVILGKAIAQTSLEEWDRLAAVNGRGTFLMMRGVLPFINKTEGSIVNMSSGAAVKPMKNLAAYGASKASIIALTKAAALELAPIRVNVVCPGVIDTPMPRDFVKNLDEKERTNALNALAEGRALKRLGLPEEIAAVVLFLASNDASYVTGSDFLVDGGKL